jgi:alginate O-acetyltransferase complex protein AlgI
MGFTSEIFIFYFLPLTLVVYHLVLRRSVYAALAFLSFASLIFYSWETPFHLALLLGSVLFNWMLSHLIVRTEHRPAHVLAIALSLIGNLGLLGFFKYAGFFYENFAALMDAVGIQPDRAEDSFLNDIILPVGISFYTFQTLSYLIDLYHGRVKEARSFVEFLCYVSSFPQLVAGPIVRYTEIRDQLAKPIVTREMLELGIFIFIMGLAKKALIADSLEPLASHVFDGNTVETALVTLAGVGAYTLQLYFDFSGYSEMAIGMGLMLGFRFPQNFNSPYKARTARDFWRRWHISLSSWFRDYLYIPLGGNRHGMLNKHRNLLLTMAFVGLWHGAGWTFVIWGVGHGVALVVDEFLSRLRQSRGVTVLRHAWVVFVVVLLWVPFRAADLGVTGLILEKIAFNWAGIAAIVSDVLAAPSEVKFAGLVLPFALFGALTRPNVFEMTPPRSLPAAIVLSVLLAVSVYVLLARDYVPFLYFQF